MPTAKMLWPASLNNHTACHPIRILPPVAKFFAKFERPKHRLPVKIEVSQDFELQAKQTTNRIVHGFRPSSAVCVSLHIVNS